MSSDITVYEKDSLTFTVNVKDSAGIAFPLTGATAVAIIAGSEPLRDSIQGTTNIPTPLDGKINVSFPANSLAAGSWTAQTVVTIGSVVQTVSDVSVKVNKSHPAP